MITARPEVSLSECSTDGLIHNISLLIVRLHVVCHAHNIMIGSKRIYDFAEWKWIKASTNMLINTVQLLRRVIFFSRIVWTNPTLYSDFLKFLYPSLKLTNSVRGKATTCKYGTVSFIPNTNQRNTYIPGRLLYSIPK